MRPLAGVLLAVVIAFVVMRCWRPRLVTIRETNPDLYRELVHAFYLSRQGRSNA